MKIDEIYYYDYIIRYTKILYSSNIYTFTYTCPEKKTHKVFQNSNETNESETNPKKNICATFAENNFTL